MKFTGIKAVFSAIKLSVSNKSFLRNEGAIIQYSIDLSHQTNAASWMKLLQHKSPVMYSHSVRVALISMRLAKVLNLNNSDTQNLTRGCFLHDIGKIMIPEAILHKDEQLTKQQWEIMKLHPEIGVNILERNGYCTNDISEIVHYHHERIDGKGYPGGLAGDEIPFFARACSIIDAFDCMMSDRPYRKRTSIQEATKELVKHSGSQFDERIVGCFLELEDYFIRLYEAAEAREQADNAPATQGIVSE